MNEIYVKLWNFFRAALPSEVTIVVANQNAPRPLRPLMTMKLSQTREIGIQRKVGLNDQRTLNRWAFFTVSCQFFGEREKSTQSEELAQKVLDAYYDLNLRLETLGREIAFTQVLSGPTSIDEVIGSEFEPRVILDLGLCVSRESVSAQLESIDLVEYESNIEN